MPRRSLAQLYKDEFTGYSFSKFLQDMLSGLTVAAVALPLALAFGIASGSSVSAGLVAAIVAGFVIGAYAGAPYQISGPTGAMSVACIMLVQKYGLTGVWTAGLMAGIFLTIIGLLRLGRFLAFIPMPIIAGFTSGIGVIIFIGQIDNFLGVKTAWADSAALKLLNYFNGGFLPNWHAIGIGGVVIATMLLWPQKWNTKFPSSLLGIILATIVNTVVNWPVQIIGEISQTLFLADRLNFSDIPVTHLSDFLTPALIITAIGAIESLLCGSVGSKMTGIRLQTNQELIAQGIGNMVIPFFGGIPATAAIARTSVGIKSGGQTRLVSIIHAIGLLLAMFVLAPLMARIPLAALAGMLMVTAIRMNEWEGIRFIFSHRFKTSIITFSITLLATITLDLTQAILIGILLSGVMFLNNIAMFDVLVTEVDAEKLRQHLKENASGCQHVRVAFLTGPLFFAATGQFSAAFANLSNTHAVIISMRGVPLIDASGIEEIRRLYERIQKQGGTLMFAGVHENTRNMMDRGGLVELVGAENFFWSSDQAISEVEKRGCKFCGAPSSRFGSG